MSKQVAAKQKKLRPSKKRDFPVLTVSLEEAARITGLGMTTLHLMVRDGKLRSTKIGARRLIFADSLDDALRAGEQ